MGNDLRERLEALSATATQGLWGATFDEAYNIRDIKRGIIAQMRFLKGVGGLGGRRDTNEVAYSANFIVALVNAFRSGDLVTRSELEEAVAKAVAEEREAIAKLHDEELEALVEESGSYDPSTGQTEFPEWVEDRLEWHEDYAAKVRARSEQKEGE